MDLVELVRTASADAWEMEGRMRAGVAEPRDMRLMASGLPLPSWNNADVTGPDPDLDAARAFYAQRGVPWGVRVPAGTPFASGRLVLRQRLMGMPAPALREVPAVDGLELRLAGPADASTVVALDAVGFGEDPEVTRPWVEPHVSAAGFEVALASCGGEDVGTAFTVRTDGRAGPALYLGGVTVMERARGRGVAAATSAWLLGRGLADGAKLAHLHADDERAARVYKRLGLVDAGAMDVYLGV